VAALLQSEDDARLEPFEVVPTFVMLLEAGNETSASLIARAR
jgi:cytochrome P450